MAAGRILVDIPQIEAAKNDYTNAKQNEGDAINAMDSAVRTLDGYWDGPASEAYIANFNRLRQIMDQSQAAMDDAINDLGTLINETTATETSNIQSEAAALPTGTNFF